MKSKSILNRDIFNGMGGVIVPKGSEVEIIEYYLKEKKLLFNYHGHSIRCEQEWITTVDEPLKLSHAQERKQRPVYSGVLKYFPNALKEVAHCSFTGNEQHHPGTQLHWDMSKSADEQDALVRHLIDHSINPMDDDGVLHLTKVAWRALAGLERYLTNKEHKKLAQ